MANNKTALITGGAKRIGKALCQELASKGYNIALHYNKSKIEAEDLKTHIKKTYKVECEVFSSDLGEIPNCFDLVKSSIQKFSKIDLLINNASVFYESMFLETDEEIINDNFDVNFKAPFFLTQEYTKNSSNGHIINIIDSNYRRNASKFFTYNLSKKSLADFTKMAALELAPKFRVNGIAPGAILPSIDMPEKEFEEHKKKLPLQETATCKDIANTIIDLENNKAITGQIIFVDGGKHLL